MAAVLHFPAGFLRAEAMSLAKHKAATIDSWDTARCVAQHCAEHPRRSAPGPPALPKWHAARAFTRCKALEFPKRLRALSLFQEMDHA